LLRDQSPALFDEMASSMAETYYSQRLRPWYHNFIDIQIDIAFDALEKVYGGTEIEARGKKFLTESDLFDRMVSYTHTRNRFSVINHGDCEELN
jgi:hypothetical protein